MNRPEWIALDWGTSHLRVWAMSEDGEIMARASSERGMAVLERADYEPALLELIEPWLSTGEKCQVVGCGMVGSQQGWIEVPYRTTPCAPLGRALAAPVSDQRIRVSISPGLKQDDPPDVMRGEETQIAGLLGHYPEFEGVVCLPGTHSKWAQVGGGEIRSFQTFLTGELFGLLAHKSVLRHSVAGGGWDKEAFLEAVGAALAAPEAISAQLFSIRAESLLHQSCGVRERSRLSGYLIGCELAAVRRDWSGKELALIGTEGLAEVYASGLRAAGARVTLHSGESLALAGLRNTYDNLMRQ